MIRSIRSGEAKGVTPLMRQTNGLKCFLSVTARGNRKSFYQYGSAAAKRWSLCLPANARQRGTRAIPCFSTGDSTMTRFFDYLRLRNKGFRFRRAVTMSQGDPLGDKVVLVAVLIVFMWLGLDSINGYLNERDDRAEAHAVKRSAATVERLERVVVACLNGKAINVSGTAYECRAGSLGVKL